MQAAACASGEAWYAGAGMPAAGSRRAAHRRSAAGAWLPADAASADAPRARVCLLSRTCGLNSSQALLAFPVPRSAPRCLPMPSNPYLSYSARDDSSDRMSAGARQQGHGREAEGHCKLSMCLAVQLLLHAFANDQLPTMALSATCCTLGCGRTCSWRMRRRGQCMRWT